MFHESARALWKRVLIGLGDTAMLEKRSPVLTVGLLGIMAICAPAFAQDADGDGVDDGADVCCNTPIGIAVDAEGRPVGDLDVDCDVDLEDYALVASNFTGHLGDPCCPLSPLDDQTGQPPGGIPEVIISEIKPGEFIEVHNTTDADVDLSSVVWQWCSPLSYAVVATSVVIPPKGFATLNWPSNFFNSTATNGEIILFLDTVGFFNDATRQLDYVCWGTGPKIRKTQAEGVGKWSGDCAAAFSEDGSIRRKANTDGTTAESYEITVTADPTDCP